MEKVLIQTAKKAPVVTAALVIFVYVISQIIDKNLPVWALVLIACLTFALSSIVIIFVERHKMQGQGNLHSDVSVTGNDLSDVKTGGGDILVGTSGGVSSRTKVEGNNLLGVDTNGGDLTIGVKNE